MTLAALTEEHHASLLASCWRELGTLDVDEPQIAGVYGVEDFSHPRNRVGMLEVECISGGRRVQLTGERMVPLVHGYHRAGPNGAIDEPRPSYYFGGKVGGGMPDLSLIRLPPPSLDRRLIKLLLSQPAVMGSLVGMLASSAFVGSEIFTGSARTAARWLLAAWWVGHVIEGVFALFVCVTELKLSWRDACAWAGLVTLVGIACTRSLLKLRPARHLKKVE